MIERHDGSFVQNTVMASPIPAHFLSHSGVHGWNPMWGTQLESRVGYTAGIQCGVRGWNPEWGTRLESSVGYVAGTLALHGLNLEDHI